MTAFSKPPEAVMNLLLPFLLVTAAGFDLFLPGADVYWLGGGSSTPVLPVLPLFF